MPTRELLAPSQRAQFTEGVKHAKEMLLLAERNVILAEAALHEYDTKQEKR